MKRTFIAVSIRPDPSLGSFFSELRERFCDERIRLADTSKLHLTLAFLGPTGIDKEKLVHCILEETIRSGFAMEPGGFAMQLKGLGVFPSIKRPRVLWIGIEGVGPLAGIREKITSGLKEKGVDFDDSKGFRPHLTIARIKYIKDTAGLEEFIERYRNYSFQAFVVDRIQYFESLLKPTGAEYKLLGEYMPGD